VNANRQFRYTSIQWIPGALSLGAKWPGREADHSPDAADNPRRLQQ